MKKTALNIMIILSSSPQATYKSALLEGNMIDKGIIWLRRRNNETIAVSVAVISLEVIRLFVKQVLTTYLNFTDSIWGNNYLQLII